MTSVPEALSHKFKNMAIVCAILIVVHHINLDAFKPVEPLWVFNMLIRYGICLVGVPFFFLTSGYFLAGHIGEEGWWKREAYKRVRTLLVPFILWNVIFLLYNGSLASITDIVAHRAFGTSLAFLKNPRYLFLGFYPIIIPPLGLLWYIRALLLLVLVSPVIVWALKRFPRVFILGAWVFSILAFFMYGFDSNIRFLFSPEGVTYFALGIFLRLHPIHVEGRKLWAWSVIIALVLLSLRLWASYIGSNLVSPLVRLSIPFVMYAIWEIIPAKRWARGFTSLAFPCYLIHPFVLSAFHFTFIALAKGLGVSQSMMSEVEVRILLVLTVPVTLLLGCAMRRCFPRVAGVLFGGR